MIILNINNRRLPLPSRYLSIEQDVNLAIRSTLHLRQEEKSDNEACKPSSSPNIATFATEICTL